MFRFALVLICCLVLPAWAAQEARLPVGEFTAGRFAQAPTVDGKLAPGEWDRAFITSGLIAPFEHELHESVTEMGLGYDDERLYFLFRCQRGNFEWKLWKKARENDAYDFGDSSVEIWVSPPALVAETYQNVINTYPAVLDQKMIPTRGYTAQGWKGNWTLGVSESDAEYVIEASIPIRDFGPARITSGEVWRFLMARTCHGAKPRSQASWSITQGFAEIPQHPPVRLVDDGPLVQLRGIHTLFTGQYQVPVTVIAPRGAAAAVAVELRFHAAKTPGAEDQVVRQTAQVAAGQSQVLTFAGDCTAFTPADAKGVKRGHLTVTATAADGQVLHRQSFPYSLSVWTPTAPQKPAKAPEVQELDVAAQYGPETNTLLVTADLFDLPTRAQAASAEVVVTDPASGAELARQAARPIREWYSGAEVQPTGIEIPVHDFASVAALRAEVKQVRARNAEHKEKKEPLEALPEVPITPGRKVLVTVTVKDQAGQPLKSASREVELLRYRAQWMNNDVGLSDEPLPPWQPLTAQGGAITLTVSKLELDGLGLARRIDNGGVAQLAAPMRLVAVQGGQETTVAAPPPTVASAVPARADLTGSAEAAGLRFAARTRVEYDGFVRIDLDIAPAAAPATVDRLYLEIALPAAEATHFCTTAGGWAATHDALPDRWDSRTTASGMLVGDFVPYIWLTNSDRAFLWFADHDRGWHHDPDKRLPTQELVRQGDTVVLRVNFFELPTTVDGPRTLTWGWQTFPNRPLPAGWRAIFCATAPPVPHTTATHFWFDGDWAVLWPYYCSPFPWSMVKSKEHFDKARERSAIYRPLVGSIAHSIGRYLDYEGNPFPGLAVDWGATPGQIGNSDVTASRGPNDFRLWHYRQWVREAGLQGLYVDENYIALEDNFLTGNAYWRPDGRLQRAYNYLGLREYFHRLKTMLYQEGVARPNLWQHISSGAAYHAWPGDIFMEGENVEPTDLQTDYLEVLPAGRMRAIGSAVTAGAPMLMMCQSLRHRTQWWEKHTHQFVGWVMAHDIIAEQVDLHPILVEAGHLWAPDARFLPYWKPSPFTTTAKDVVVSAHATPGRALLTIVNTGRQPAQVPVAIDRATCGLPAGPLTAWNAETGAPLPLTEAGLTLTVPERDFVPVLLVPPGPDGATLVATFEQGAKADWALYSDAITSGRGKEPLALVPGEQGGQAAGLATGVNLLAHLALADDAGRVTWRMSLGDKGGMLLRLGNLTVQLKAGKQFQWVVQQAASGKDAKDGAVVEVPTAAPTAGWHAFTLAWQNGKTRLLVDGQPVAELATRPFGLALPPGKELKQPLFSFGGGPGSLLGIDDIRCYRTAE
jgi:hypothetical protein